MNISYRIIAWTFSILILLLSLFVVSKLQIPERTLINYITIFGTSLSFIGIVLTFVQVRSVKETSEFTKNAVTQTVNKLNTVLTIYDITKASQIIQSAQGYLRDQRNELAYFKMKDLKEFLIQIKHLQDIEVFEVSENFEESYQNFIFDLTNLNLIITNTGKSVNRNTIINNLEGLSTELTKIENSIKYKEIYGN